MIYLASPYSHPDPQVREERFQAACRAAAELMREGLLVFSPIAQTHPLTAYGLPTGWDFWERYDLAHVENCSEVRVLKLAGWEESRGVKAEIAIAVRLGKLVTFMEVR